MVLANSRTSTLGIAIGAFAYALWKYGLRGLVGALAPAERADVIVDFHDYPGERPDPAEAGWKDTIHAFPNMVTRIIVPLEALAGRYVWHCHVLEHEDHEMMRPYEIIDQQKTR